MAIGTGEVKRSLVVLWMLLLSGGQSVRAVKYQVPEGYPTIQAGVDACSLGDTVSVGPGVYAGPGNREIDFHGIDLSLQSREGPDATVIDGEGAYTAIHLEGFESLAAIIEGFTMTRCVGVSGGAVSLGPASATFRRCIFLENQALTGGAALIVSNPAVFEDCKFFRNSDRQQNGNGGGALRIVGSIFGEVTLRRCVFAGNKALFEGGAIKIDGARVIIEDCTIAHNSCVPNGDGGGIHQASGDLLMERTVLWGNCAGGEGADLYSTAGNQTITCSDVDPSKITSSQVTYGEGVFTADPLFCDPRSCTDEILDGDYHLRSDSPCLPEGNACGVLIGSLDVGCAAPGSGACCLPDEVCVLVPRDECLADNGVYQGDGTACEPNPCQLIPVQNTTWGRIKASYRDAAR
jgi:hypothetical protein